MMRVGKEGKRSILLQKTLRTHGPHCIRNKKSFIQELHSFRDCYITTKLMIVL